ncbi:hypothetical protein [Lederbergia lenta]|uniref:hypothetical protein n=1 Tax=Lederbergia lenta TaxID=1467 RepID=UPI00203CD67B|nr:hypothetical protein [Lederbergia lenta]MCM3113598.1 hypothetical protein [Lederbergia lenta]
MWTIIQGAAIILFLICCGLLLMTEKRILVFKIFSIITAVALFIFASPYIFHFLNGIKEYSTR